MQDRRPDAGAVRGLPCPGPQRRRRLVLGQRRPRSPSLISDTSSTASAGHRAVSGAIGSDTAAPSTSWPRPSVAGRDRGRDVGSGETQEGTVISGPAAACTAPSSPPTAPRRVRPAASLPAPRSAGWRGPSHRGVPAAHQLPVGGLVQRLVPDDAAEGCRGRLVAARGDLEPADCEQRRLEGAAQLVAAGLRPVAGRHVRQEVTAVDHDGPLQAGQRAAAGRAWRAAVRAVGKVSTSQSRGRAGLTV